MKRHVTDRSPPENEIAGETLIALRHDELKEMGVLSVGHRLTILKGVYETKVKQDIPFEADHYVPLCESTGRCLSYSKLMHSQRPRPARTIRKRRKKTSPD